MHLLWVFFYICVLFYNERFKKIYDPILLPKETLKLSFLIHM
jgi:hypothetical protein